MKKLLTLLAAFGLTVTPVTSVVACGTKKDDKNADQNSTNTIIKGSWNYTADDLLSSANVEKIFGQPSDAVHDFMNYFAFQIVRELSNENSNILKLFNSSEYKKYINDGFLNTIQKQYQTSQQAAEDKWNNAVDAAKKNGGKKWEETFRKQLEKDLNRTFNSYQDAKQIYITNEMMKGTNGTSVIDALTNAINALPQDMPTRNLDSISNNFLSIIMSLNTTIGGVKVNLSSTFGPNPTEDLLTEMTNLLAGLKNSINSDGTTSPQFDLIASNLIFVLNATGGLGNDEDTDVINKPLVLGKINWVGMDNFKAEILKSPENVAKKIIRRADSNFKSDYDISDYKNWKKKTSTFNPEFGLKNPDYANFSAITNFINLGADKSQLGNATTKGLWSNAQRFYANQFYQTQKPVALSEIIIAPLNDGTKLSDNVNNSAFINSTSTYDSDSMYKFIQTFANGEKWETNNVGANYTINHYGETSDWSWDKLMNVGGDLSKIDSNNSGISTSGWTTNFKSKVSLKQHDKLLTLSSSSSDYSDILKYSIYDFIQKGNKVADFDPSTLVPNEANDGSVTKINNADISGKQLEITNLINSLNRRGLDYAKNNVYQVLNAKQGIIAYVDTDGLHLVRIEGWEKLGDLATVSKDSESYITTNDYSKGGATNSSIKNMQTIESIAANLGSNSSLNDSTKNQIQNETYNYLADNSQSYFSYNDLNSSFGNSYLQFLANSSIVTSMGLTTGKEKYDLSKEVSSYIATSAPSSTSPQTLWYSSWSYFLNVLGFKNNLDLFDALFGNTLTDKTSMFFGFSNLALDDTSKNTLYSNYRNYITNQLNIFNSNLQHTNLLTGWVNWNNSSSSIDVSSDENKFKPVNTIQNNNAIGSAKNWIVNVDHKDN